MWGILSPTLSLPPPPPSAGRVWFTLCQELRICGACHVAHPQGRSAQPAWLPPLTRLAANWYLLSLFAFW